MCKWQAQTQDVVGTVTGLCKIYEKRKTNVSNKKTALFFLILAILMVLFFPFQNPEQRPERSGQIMAGEYRDRC